jgi:hypothetical protein
MGTGVLSRGQSDRGLKLGFHLQLVPMLRMSGAISLLPLYAFTILRLPPGSEFNNYVFFQHSVFMAVRSNNDFNVRH